MAIAHSKLTAQGQISVPSAVRKRLGVGPGSVLAWEDNGDGIVVRKAARFTSQEVHDALFPDQESIKAKSGVKAGLREYVRRRHARD